PRGEIDDYPLRSAALGGDGDEDAVPSGEHYEPACRSSEGDWFVDGITAGPVVNDQRFALNGPQPGSVRGARERRGPRLAPIAEGSRGVGARAHHLDGRPGGSRAGEGGTADGEGAAIGAEGERVDLASALEVSRDPSSPRFHHVDASVGLGDRQH